MKQRWMTAALAAGIFAASCLGMTRAAEAGTLETTTNDSDSGGYTGLYGGGEFAVVTFSLGPTLDPLGSGVQVNSYIFQTFCLEANERMIFGQTLDFTVDTTANAGGFGGGSPDPLDSRTAYLFTQFWNGTLSGYNYTLGTGRMDSATALQLAIWKLEDELGTSSLQDAYDSNSLAQSFVSAADSAVASGGSWFGKGLGDVRILNLTLNGTNLQSVLVQVTPIPLPPAALLGLGIMTGLGGLGLVRRRNRPALV